MAIHAVNVPVSVGGMDVAPGEIIHMDETGACKFPADKLEQVHTNVQELLADETEKIRALEKCSTAAEVRSVLGGHSYAKDDR